MSNTLDAETNGASGEPLDPAIREELRKSRQYQQDAVEAQARAEAAERRSVFAEVGIPSGGMGDLFRTAYAGDLTPEAVKAAAEGYGILGTGQQQSQQDQGLTDQERAAQQRIAGAGTGIPPSGSDPRADIANQILQIPYQVGGDPKVAQDKIMALIDQLQNEHPEVGRFTNPNN